MMVQLMKGRRTHKCSVVVEEDEEARSLHARQVAVVVLWPIRSVEKSVHVLDVTTALEVEQEEGSSQSHVDVESTKKHLMRENLALQHGVLVFGMIGTVMLSLDAHVKNVATVTNQINRQHQQEKEETL